MTWKRSRVLLSVAACLAAGGCGGESATETGTDPNALNTAEAPGGSATAVRPVASAGSVSGGSPGHSVPAQPPAGGEPSGAFPPGATAPGGGSFPPPASGEPSGAFPPGATTPGGSGGMPPAESTPGGGTQGNPPGAGATPDDGEADGNEQSEALAKCAAVRSRVVGLDQRTPLGFRGRDILQLVRGEHIGSLRWATGGESRFTLTVHYRGKTRFNDNEWLSRPGDNGVMLMAHNCADTVELDVRITLRSSDGQFAESFDSKVVAQTPNGAVWRTDLEQLAGGFDPSDFIPQGEDVDQMRAWIAVKFSPQRARGSIVGQASGVSGDIAFAQRVDIARLDARRR